MDLEILLIGDRIVNLGSVVCGRPQEAKIDGNGYQRPCGPISKVCIALLPRLTDQG